MEEKSIVHFFEKLTEGKHASYLSSRLIPGSKGNTRFGPSYILLLEILIRDLYFPETLIPRFVFKAPADAF